MNQKLLPSTCPLPCGEPIYVRRYQREVEQWTIDPKSGQATLCVHSGLPDERVAVCARGHTIRRLWRFDPEEEKLTWVVEEKKP